MSHTVHVLFSYLVYLFDDSGWITAHDHIVGHVLRYNSTGGHNGIPTDGYPRTDDGSDADPCILFDGHLPEMKQVVSVVEVVIYRCNLNLGADQHVILYHHLPRRENRSSLVDRDMLADRHPASAVAIEWGDDGDTVIDLMLEQLFQQSLIIRISGLPGRNLQAQLMTPDHLALYFPHPRIAMVARSRGIYHVKHTLIT